MAASTSQNPFSRIFCRSPIRTTKKTKRTICKSKSKTATISGSRSGSMRSLKSCPGHRPPVAAHLVMPLSAKRTNTSARRMFGAAAVRAALTAPVLSTTRSTKLESMFPEQLRRATRIWLHRSMKPQRSPAISSSSARRALLTTWVSTWAMGKWSMRPVRASRSQTSTPAEPGLSVGAELAAPRRAALLPLHRQARKAAAQDLPGRHAKQRLRIFYFLWRTGCILRWRRRRRTARHGRCVCP